MILTLQPSSIGIYGLNVIIDPIVSYITQEQQHNKLVTQSNQLTQTALYEYQVMIFKANGKIITPHCFQGLSNDYRRSNEHRTSTIQAYNTDLSNEHFTLNDFNFKQHLI